MQDQAIETIAKYAEADDDTITLTCGQLDRDLYKAVDTLFKRFRGQWKGGKIGAHIFPYPIMGQDVIDSIVAGEIPPKNPYALFPTPDHVLDEMMREIHETFPDRDASLRFLEPSAGTGAIASRLRTDYPNATIDCVEIDPLNVRILHSQGFDVIHDDFMSFEPTADYDAIVMNPPFQGNTYIDHIMQALGMVDREGVLVSIIPANITFGSTKAVFALLETLHERGGTVEQLPAESFKESGTTVDTYVMSMRGSPPEFYRESRIDTLMILVGNDYETYDQLNEVVASGVTSIDEKFKRNVKRLYTAYMSKNRLTYFIQPTDDEWEVLYRRAAEQFDFDLGEEEPEAMPEPEAEAIDSYAQMALFA